MKIKIHTSFVGDTGYNAHSKAFFTKLSKLVKLKIRNFTVGGSWAGLSKDPHGEDMTEYQKSLMGEQTVIGDNGFYDAEIYDGMSDIEDYDIDLVLNETNHHYFYDDSKFKGKFKIAYNVWESTRQPEQFFEKLLEFDQLWVPSEWQKEVSIEQGFPAEKVFVVPEAVESKIFFPDKNKKILDEYKDNRFKFIVFGRWDYRKSTQELIETFLSTFDESEPVDLIMSIENPYSVDDMKTTDERLERYKLKDPRIKILNFPSRDDYIEYLKNGHVFLSCARSEGWNLPLIEAIACGTPAIYTDWGAQLQFAEGKGHPVKIVGLQAVGSESTYGLGKKANDGSHGINSDSTPGQYCEPDFKDLSKVMRDTYVNYWEYKGKALKDSELVRKEFSWENAAATAKKILDGAYYKIYGKMPLEPTKVTDGSDFVFLTGGDEGYLPIVETCVKSMQKYSNIPIIVYGFNCDVPFDYPNMEKRRIDVIREKPQDDRDTRPYYFKIDASLDCIYQDDTKTYTWIDGDCIVNHNIDSIVKYKNQIDEYPLCMRYKHENLIHRGTTLNGYSERGHGDECGTLFGVKRNNDFTVATGLYMFDSRSKPFFDEVIHLHNYFLENVSAINCVDDMALAEERLFNVLFWKYNYKNYMHITWISNAYFKFESGNDFTPKIENYIRSGFDIMFDYDGTDPLQNNLDDQSKILFYHGQRDVSKVEKLLDKIKDDKLMVVAHPDDETIFGGGMLLNEDGWKVVVVTDGGGDGNDSEIRKLEFIKVMNKLGIKNYEILDFKDDMNEVLYDEAEVEDKLRNIISSKKWKKIVTHNQDGEYGHVIHKSVHNIMKKINPDNLGFFEKSDNKLNKVLFKQKNQLLALYESQNTTNMPSFRDYLVYEGVSQIEDYSIMLEIENEIYKPTVVFNFDNLLSFVDIRDSYAANYNVEFLDNDKLVYNVEMENNHWASTKKMSEQLNWIIKIMDLANGKYVFEHSFTFEYKNIKFILDGSIEKIKQDLDIITIIASKYDANVFISSPFGELEGYEKLNFNEIQKISYYATYNFNESHDLNKIFKRWI